MKTTTPTATSQALFLAAPKRYRRAAALYDEPLAFSGLFGASPPRSTGSALIGDQRSGLMPKKKTNPKPVHLLRYFSQYNPISSI
jgi:hypothetical protein